MKTSRITQPVRNDGTKDFLTSASKSPDALVMHLLLETNFCNKTDFPEICTLSSAMLTPRQLFLCDYEQLIRVFLGPNNNPQVKRQHTELHTQQSPHIYLKHLDSATFENTSSQHKVTPCIHLTPPLDTLAHKTGIMNYLFKTK